jgi:translation initiation factor 2D
VLSGSLPYIANGRHTTLHKPHFLTLAFTNYITKHNLVVPNDHRNVLLDAELGRAMGVKKPEPGQTMTRDDILKKLRAGVAWSVSINGQIR